MAPLDPHSYTDGAHPVVSHAAVAFYLNFASSAIHASALLTLSALHSGDLLLDMRALTVHSASTDAADAPEPIPFSLAASPDPVLGTALTVTLLRSTAQARMPPPPRVPGSSEDHGVAVVREVPVMEEWAHQQYVSKHQQWASQQWGNFYYYRMHTIRFDNRFSYRKHQSSNRFDNSVRVFVPDSTTGSTTQ